MRATLALLLILIAGCSAPHTPAPEAQPDLRDDLSNTDPCAMRLHDICGPLLLFDSTYEHLPPTLADLRKLPGFANLDLTCPVSHQPYLYAPNGIIVPGQSGRIIVYDPLASHADHRWAIVLLPPNRDGALWTKVVALPVGWPPPAPPAPPPHQPTTRPESPPSPAPPTNAHG